MTGGIKRAVTESWLNREGSVDTTPDILEWIRELNKTTHVSIEECGISDCGSWMYDSEAGRVVNRNGKFFSISGMRWSIDGEAVSEQPVMIQPEIGYLGILCGMVNGTLSFLMQAKIEPGNVNCVQLSPTIQATRSNFLRAHGGRTPTYLEVFSDPKNCTALYDQVQTEQGSRFLRKRNRNMILLLDDDAVGSIKVYPNFRWMTLGQIKDLMKEENLVNMDTRTVISGLPIDETVLCPASYADSDRYISAIFRKLNDYKMYHDVSDTEVPLDKLNGWTVSERGIDSTGGADFMVRYYGIEIEGREVRQWNQPLFKAAGMATFGLISRDREGRTEYLIRVKPEIGSFDMAEMGPSVQWESTCDPAADSEVDAFFRQKTAAKEGIVRDVILSEEGGRFYHEQNRNLIIKIDDGELADIPDDYVWADLSSLSRIIRSGGGLNIQLRNLVSLIDI